MTRRNTVGSRRSAAPCRRTASPDPPRSAGAAALASPRARNRRLASRDHLHSDRQRRVRARQWVVRTDDAAGSSRRRSAARGCDFAFAPRAACSRRSTSHDARLARIVKRCQDLPGQTLFQYLDDGGRQMKLGSSRRQRVRPRLSPATGSPRRTCAPGPGPSTRRARLLMWCPPTAWPPENDRSSQRSTPCRPGSAIPARCAGAATSTRRYSTRSSRDTPLASRRAAQRSPGCLRPRSSS